MSEKPCLLHRRLTPRNFPIYLPGLTPTQELKERAYAEVGGEEPRTKKTQDKTILLLIPEKEKPTREDCSNTLFSWQAGSVAQNSKDVQVLKDLLQGFHSLDQRLQPINVMGSCIDASLQFLDLVLQILLVSVSVQSLGVYQQLPDAIQESGDFSEHFAHAVKDSSNLWLVLCLEIIPQGLFKVTFIYRKFINSYTDKFIILERDISIYIYLNIYIYISNSYLNSC